MANILARDPISVGPGGTSSAELQRSTAAALAGLVYPVYDDGIDRSAMDRFLDVLNVTEFGAVGDGDTSKAATNTAAINRAISIKHAMGGGMVHVPKGTYYTNDNINLMDNVILVGEGYATLISNIALSGFQRCVIVSGNIGDIAANNGLYAETAYNILSASRGTNKVTMASLANIATFVVGDVVAIASYEHWSTGVTADNHEKYLNLNEVADLDAVTGVITLRYPLRDNYPATSGNPTIRRLTGSFNAYRGDPMWAAKNCGVKNMRLRQKTGLASGWYALFPCGVNQTYENIWMDDVSGMIGTNGLCHSVFKNIRGSFEARFLDICDWVTDNLFEDIIASKYKVNAALPVLGIGINNGADITLNRVKVALGSYGGASFYMVHRGKFRDVDVIDAGADDAILLGLGDDCEAVSCKSINPHKNGITLAGVRPRVHNCSIPSVGSGGYSVFAQAAVGVCYVHDNQFGIEGAETPNDRFYQVTMSPDARVYNNTGYVEAVARKGRVNWSGAVQTSAASYAVLKTASLKGTSGVVRGFRVTAAGSKSGTAGTKDIKLCLGSTTIASLSYAAGDSGTWELTAVISVRPDTNAVHAQGKGIKNTSLLYSVFQIIANGLVSDTNITVEGQVANAADVIGCNVFVVEPILEMLQ